MADTIKAVRGMPDILPEACESWVELENAFQVIASEHGYSEIRFPLLEKEILFRRSIGDATDIVEKEMFRVFDQNDEALCLRPEGTASSVRVALEHQLLRQGEQRWWYRGPMFRYERPQKGRYRQFHQIGVENLGNSDLGVLLDQLQMTRTLWKQLGIEKHLRLEINHLGTRGRLQFKAALTHYLEAYKADLDEDSQRRLVTNPLRILDSKVPQTKALLEGGPTLSSFWSEEEREAVTLLEQVLSEQSVEVHINPQLVRGLDYYTGLVYEWTTEALGAQGTLAAGGQYDDLVVALGGPLTPAVGFAMGLERVLLLKEQCAPAASSAQSVDWAWVVESPAYWKTGLNWFEPIRARLTHPQTGQALRCLSACRDRSLKAQLKRADKARARVVCLWGEREQAASVATLKWLQEERPQQTVPLTELETTLREALT